MKKRVGTSIDKKSFFVNNKIISKNKFIYISLIV